MGSSTYPLSCMGCQYLKFMGKKFILVGVLNVTPDSFSDGGLFLNPDVAVSHAMRMVTEGADIIDVGGESTRPGATPVPVDEELRRVLPVVEQLADRGVRISIDTYKSEVAEAALKLGAEIVNDVSGLRFDPRMPEVIAKYNAKVVIMHMKGTPQTMQINPYYEDVMHELITYFNERLEFAQSYGIKRENIIIDPGIGFGKRVEDNLTILRNLSSLCELGTPVMIGVSRKSFIGKILGIDNPRDRVIGSIASNLIAFLNGATYFRVHDVKPTLEALTMVDAILSQHEGSAT